MRWSDRFGPFRLVRKAHPSFQPNNGMRLPNGVGSETASQNIGLERDGLSESALKRKPHPALGRGLRTKAGP